MSDAISNPKEMFSTQLARWIETHRQDLPRRGHAMILGVSHQQYYRMLNGHIPTRGSTLALLSKALGKTGREIVLAAMTVVPKPAKRPKAKKAAKPKQPKVAKAA